MKKFLLRRIGMADDRSSARPTLHDCIEVVLLQADTLMGAVLAGLAASTTPTNTKGKASFGTHAPVSKTVTDLLCSQSLAVKQTFVAQLRLGIYNSGSQDFAEQALVRFEDLQLFDSKQIDASIEFALAQQEVARGVEDVLPSLNALVSSLLGWITVQPKLNPLKPDVFVRALQACLVQYAPDEQARAALIVPAAGLLGVSLRQLYREICDWLWSQGIEPASPVGTPVGGGSAARGKSAETSVARTLVTLDKLRRLLSGELDSGVGNSGMPDFLHTVPASYLALEDMKLVEPMMRRLAQRASLPVDAGTKADASGQPIDIEREPSQGRQLGKQLGEEVVRMMIDNLMRDDRLLPKVRELIKTLEPVLLVLAQSDPRFFSERQHPARHFLDLLTHRSLGYTSENDEGFFPFYKSISDAAGVLTGEEGDAASFARVLHELQVGWTRDEAAQRQQHEEEARALLHAEQRNLLAQRLADDFQERQKNKHIPELVAGFLRGPWAQVVAQSQLGCADGSADPGGYLALVDDLLWSVQLRLTRRNRARLVQLVPNLLVTLRQGLQLIQYPEERIPVFFDALISLHEQAFEGRRLQPAAEAVDQTPPEGDDMMEDAGPSDALETSEVSGFWDDEDDEDLAAADLAEGVEPLMAAAQRPWSAGDLNTGVWVELIVEGVWLRAQLTWASPHRTLFMFVSRTGLAHSMSRRTMERLRMQGRIRFVSDGHVVDNALDAVAQTALQNDLGQVTQEP
ncbi:DUF1631 family protein [Rhodoferax sp. UBA5149]|uniref:DUF1631 family protein n=1 Tax=Rhodoferax sp. UBA5149 TaxID=1947379 RepID=UPI0025F215A1|nr:DUF1631 family protein [Rhodoferax sp. UBA5149]